MKAADFKIATLACFSGCFRTVLAVKAYQLGALRANRRFENLPVMIRRSLYKQAL